MSIGAIGQNSVSEFFEDLTYQVGYNEARSQVQNLVKDVESDAVKSALESSMNILTMGLMMLLIRSQEDFVQKVFTLAQGLVVIALASDFAQKTKNKLQNFRGFKFLKKFELFQKSYADRVATAQLVLDGANAHFSAERLTQNEGSTIDSVIRQKEHIVNRESFHLNVADKMASRYNDTLLFKMFTKSFTSNDETMIKRILGRDTASSITADELNHVADFMYVTDSAGHVTGLSEQFLTLLNGLGYVYNK
ncbi:MAG: hypothetical protein PHX44_01680 [Sulfurimonas sp.]|uniref:hypothetical protein n=1 Tax=Sulfurimonas sp. TaxID=2022749 RepID=UPI002625BD09|nr:hypothetical protein [Sulfurimonas sp.]MDD2651728.1 hypothetical protein [Sulfurimonas sp.]MDD2651745.1 hypothetical protein [Sulfurimonas sp.]MDD3451703.1 hypothetical protein [Sulfurimonas sp.]MDD3451720.1 hypothetical protein [Sulfurimonas sp.]